VSLLKFKLLLSLIFELMVTHLNDRMMNHLNGWGDVEAPRVNGPNPPPPPTLAQAIASILKSRDEQNELLRQLVANSTPSFGDNGARNTPAQAPTTYGNFAATHPPLFTEAGEPLEANHWLQATESKFRLLCYTEHQKTLFIAQQLWGDASAWWANYTTAHPTNYQVSSDKFREAFRAHHIPAGIMTKKHKEFMDLKQGRRSVYEYSKLFNHMAQYAPGQVDTNGKKNDRFMNGLSTKLHESLVLNTGGTFPESISNAIIVNDMILVHKESKKMKVIATSSSSAPPKYQTVYHPPRPTYQSCQHQQQ
jgi:hypothetical protein